MARQAVTIHQLFSFGEYPMPSTWQDQLASASTEHDVVQVARDFIAQFTPEEIARLPNPCKPQKIVDGQDVSDYAYALVRHHCDDGQGSTTPMHRLVAFFSNASARVARIAEGRAERQSA